MKAKQYKSITITTHEILSHMMGSLEDNAKMYMDSVGEDQMDDTMRCSADICADIIKLCLRDPEDDADVIVHGLQQFAVEGWTMVMFPEKVVIALEELEQNEILLVNIIIPGSKTVGVISDQQMSW